jgi:uncharacterized protein with LGFP repeats
MRQGHENRTDLYNKAQGALEKWNDLSDQHDWHVKANHSEEHNWDENNNPTFDCDDCDKLTNKLYAAKDALQSHVTNLDAHKADFDV